MSVNSGDWVSFDDADDDSTGFGDLYQPEATGPSLSELARQMDSGAVQVPGGVATGDKQTATVAPTGANGGGEQPNNPADEEGRPVLTADGKHAIPYEVLKSTRMNLQAMEQRNREAEAEIARLKAQLGQEPASAGAGQPPGAQPTAEAVAAGGLTEDELAILEEDFPEQAKAYRSQQAVLKALQDKVTAMEARVDPIHQQARQQRQTQEREQMAAIQAAVDQVPVLSYLRATAGANPANARLLAEAKEIADRFEGLPRWRNEPPGSVRFFQAVAQELEQTVGKVALPPEYQSSQTLRQQADTAVARAGQFVPTRIADLPGGVAPESDEGRYNHMSLSELSNLMITMSEAQRQEFMRRHVW
ncbi:hypothetical protein SAMN02949497_1922 [Methylomagnum ishizawai]|uniref:Uncharacterized protein n=1 Tax=Methylomagnum ishizawai TaxID=1760988 RepID=A0A1Y6CW61_9GAMM|nr:hypothetical protein [Methylomagnum ishizawai]SMF94601.1 hypothetical protein SAMN02949497_1922 [Methylomagnum ishizawai]